jgi:hypothetical protein
LDLTGLNLTDLQTEMGLGLTRVTLPAEGRFQATIDGAIGQMTVVVPESLGARIHLDTGMSVRSIPDGYRREGDVYTSPGYEAAEERADLYLSQAMGILEVRDRE